MRSLSEIETTSKRACRAMGFSWGVSEEVAKGIRLLELFGLPGVKNLNQYYENQDKENFENLDLINEDNKAYNSPLCPINLGIRFLDQVKKIENINQCRFKKVAYPILLLPFLSRSSEIIGKKISFKFDKNEFLLNFNINISSNFLDKEFPVIASEAEISFLENKDSFTDREWKNLYKLSEETFVEETESLKQGAAGAGLTDND